LLVGLIGQCFLPCGHLVATLLGGLICQSLYSRCGCLSTLLLRERCARAAVLLILQTCKSGLALLLPQSLAGKPDVEAAVAKL
jgi:hypothetical protein